MYSKKHLKRIYSCKLKEKDLKKYLIIRKEPALNLENSFSQHMNKKKRILKWTIHKRVLKIII